MSELYLVSTLLMGLFLLAVAVAVSREGQRATPNGSSGGRSSYAEWSNRKTNYDSRVVGIAQNPATWTIAFVLLAVVLLGGAVLFATGGGALQTGVLALVGALVAGYVFLGTFFAVRDRSGQTAAAVGVSAVVVGILMLLGIVVALVTA